MEVEEDRGVARGKAAVERRLEVAVDDPAVARQHLVELAQPLFARTQHPSRLPARGVDVVHGQPRGLAEAARERRLPGAVRADYDDAGSHAARPWTASFGSSASCTVRSHSPVSRFTRWIDAGAVPTSA